MLTLNIANMMGKKGFDAKREEVEKAREDKACRQI